MRNLIFKTVVATTFLVSASAAHAEIGGVPMPQTPTQQWVSPQHEYDPAIGRDIYVPPHYADRTPDGRLIHPPMTVPGPTRHSSSVSSCVSTARPNVMTR